MVDEQEMEKFLNDELDKDITQEDKVDESVEAHLQEMGFLWDRVQQKLGSDNVCFGCKKELELADKGKLHVLEAGNVDKGVIAFVSICPECKAEQEKKLEEINNQKKSEEVKKDE